MDDVLHNYIIPKLSLNFLSVSKKCLKIGSKFILTDKRLNRWNINHGITFCAKTGNLDLFKRLLSDSRGIIGWVISETVIAAVESNNLKIIEYLYSIESISKLIIPNVKDNILIKKACELGNINIVNRIKDNPNVLLKVSKNYPLRVAARKGYTEIVKILLADPKVDPSAMDNYALHKAINNGYSEIATLLLSDKRIKIIIKSLIDLFELA